MVDDGIEQDPAAARYYACTFPSTPAPIYCAWQEFADDSSSPSACPNTNFLKGVKWSPDGSCCLTVSNDNWLRVFDLPPAALQHQSPQQQTSDEAAAVEQRPQNASAPGTAAASGMPWRAGLRIHAGETVYDYCWFPGMSASDPVSCCLASTSRGQPIKIWDACTGNLRATYRAYDDADEITAATSLAFSPDGSQLVAGYNKSIRIFSVARPGRDCGRIATYRKRQEGSIPGIISCLCFSPVHQDLLAAGSYSRCIGLFDARTYEQLLLLEGHRGGITQVSFSPDGNFLYSGARQDDQIHCWDVRNTGQVLYSMTRDTGTTNQRIGFSIEPCGRHLATGGCDGDVRVFDLCTGLQVDAFRAAADTVNGVDFSPCVNLLVTASGHRRYHLLPPDGWEDTAAVAAAAAAASAAEPAEAVLAGTSDHMQSSIAAGKEKSAVYIAVQGNKRHRVDAEDDVQEQERPQQQQVAQAVDQRGVAAATARDFAALSAASYQPGGMCNGLRLWRLQVQWVGTEGLEAAVVDGEAEDVAAVVAPTDTDVGQYPTDESPEQ